MYRYWVKSFTFIFTLIISSATLANSNLRISVEELNKQLKNNNLIIIDARTAEDYEFGHIPGAVNLPEDKTYEHQDINGRIILPNKMQSLAQSLGLSTDKQIVVYDNGDLFPASRVFWSLEVYGFNKVKVLNQGFNAWQNKNLPISIEKPTIEKSDYVPVINHNRIATKLTTQIATHSPSQLIIDARNIEAYQGKTSSAKRFGHIPKAASIPASDNLVDNGNFNSLKPITSLKALYSDFSKDKKIVIYCSMGRVSATNYLVLRELGYNVSNYDASWREWGNDFNLPISQWQIAR